MRCNSDTKWPIFGYISLHFTKINCMICMNFLGHLDHNTKWITAKSNIDTYTHMAKQYRYQNIKSLVNAPWLWPAYLNRNWHSHNLLPHIALHIVCNIVHTSQYSYLYNTVHINNIQFQVIRKKDTNELRVELFTW